MKNIRLQRHLFTAMLSLVFIFMAALSTQTEAAQSYDNCTGFIDSLPATITTQGTWCLRADLTTAITSGNAITIANNNVTIDCNDFKLGGLAAGLATQANGIYLFDRVNATVRHCNIRGFLGGIYFDSTSATSSGGHLVEDNRFDGNTAFGLYVAGNGSLIQRNRVNATGGSTIFGVAYGIYAVYSVDVIDNTVTGVVPAVMFANANSLGIYTLLNVNGSITGNRVRGLVKNGLAATFSIFNSASDRITLRNNDVVGDGSPNSVGLSCSSANGRALNNVVSGFVTGINTCNNTSGNDVVP